MYQGSSLFLILLFESMGGMFGWILENTLCFNLERYLVKRFVCDVTRWLHRFVYLAFRHRSPRPWQVVKAEQNHSWSPGGDRRSCQRCGA